MEPKRPQITKTILNKINSSRGITVLHFKTYYRVLAIQTVWYWHKKNHVDQQNKTEDPNIIT